jgi:haloalkane dehalogenase
VQVGRQALHVMESGSGLPVVMLHGNPTWGFLWRKVAAALAGEKLRLVMPDLLGLGFSDKPPASAHRLEAHIELMRGLLQALELEELLFVGQDWGGPIGVGALARGPFLLKGLVVLNTVLGPPKENFRPSPFHRLARLPIVSELLFRVGGLPQSALFLAQGDKASIRGEVSRAYRYPLRSRLQNAAPLALARMVPHSMEHPSIGPLRECRSFMETFRGPTEIVWGERDPVLGRVLGRVERLLPHARVTRTEAGHFLQEEVPTEIADAIRRVARQVGS